LTSIACSDGANGLIHEHSWRFQSDITGFPNIAGSADIGGWNSPNVTLDLSYSLIVMVTNGSKCGACLAVTLDSKTVFVLAIDVSTGSTINMSKEAMDNLTNGRAEEAGVVDARVARVDSRFCGL
jgi:hypothetical protein